MELMKRIFLILSSGALLLSCSTGNTQSGPVFFDQTRAAATAAASPAPEVTPAGDSMAAPVETPPVAGPRLYYNDVDVDGQYVAMTFDDGPHKTLTPKLLDMLKQRNIKATFFVLGQLVQEYPDIVRRMVAEGHEVANHSWSHPSLNKLSLANAKSQMTRTDDAIQAAAGVRPTLMRPPYGAGTGNRALMNMLREDLGYKVILWSVDPLDWKYRNASRVANQIESHAKSGDIILAHDIHATTVEAMPAVFDNLLSRGFKFVTVSELLAMEQAPRPEASASPEAAPSAPESAALSTTAKSALPAAAVPATTP